MKNSHSTSHAARLLTALLLVAPALALAHTGNDAAAHHGLGFQAGLVHPLTGLDHLAAMLAVGLWSALTSRRFWLAPLAFAAMLCVGAWLGLGGLVSAPLQALVEPMIAASLLVMGLLLAARLRLHDGVAAAIVGGFALFHGAAHGVELAGAASAWLVVAGLLCSTVLLHLAGIGLGRALMSRDRAWTQISGAAVALLGAALLVQLA
jgi:urease accessory protein